MFRISQFNPNKYCPGCPTGTPRSGSALLGASCWIRPSANPPLTNPPQARKPTRPVSGSVPPLSSAAWPHLHPQSKKKKEKTSTLPSSSTISHIWFSFLAPKTKTTWGREEVGGVRDGAELYGRPFHVIDISSMWWDILWLKLSCLPRHKHFTKMWFWRQCWL